jgi:hypothetical protein
LKISLVHRIAILCSEGTVIKLKLGWIETFGASGFGWALEPWGFSRENKLEEWPTLIGRSFQTTPRLAGGQGFLGSSKSNSLEQGGMVFDLCLAN